MSSPAYRLAVASLGLLALLWQPAARADRADQRQPGGGERIGRTAHPAIRELDEQREADRGQRTEYRAEDHVHDHDRRGGVRGRYRRCVHPV